MSTKSGGLPKGAPKHQNRSAWKANVGVKKKDKELGGKLHPYPPITGVCPRCKAQIEWRRKYGKYKALIEPTKCNQCSKRSVRQAYHALCSDCARERNICAKCCQSSEIIVGRDFEKEEGQRRELEQALKTLRERDKRTLLRVMNRGMPKGGVQEENLETNTGKHGTDKETEEDSEFEEVEELGSSCSEGGNDACQGPSDCKKGRESFLDEFDLQKLSMSSEEG